MKKNTSFLLVILNVSICLMFISCNNKPLVKDQIVGKWKVVNFNAEIPNVPNTMLKRGEIIALSSNYEINSDMTYTLIIDSNSIDNCQRYEGHYTLDEENKTFILDHKTISFQKNGRWKNIEKDDINKNILKKVVLKIERIDSNELKLSEKENEGFIYYTIKKQHAK